MSQCKFSNWVLNRCSINFFIKNTNLILTADITIDSSQSGVVGNDLTAWLTHTIACNHPPTIKPIQWRTRAQRNRLNIGSPLMKGLGVRKNISISDAKLMLGLRAGFISCHLTAGTLFLVNPKAMTVPPKMSILLRSKACLHWSLNQGLSLFCRRMTLAVI